MSKTFHGKNGRFTSFNRASTVTQDGARFRMVRTLEPINGESPEVEDAKSKMAEFESRIAPRWLSLDEVFKK